MTKSAILSHGLEDHVVGHDQFAGLLAGVVPGGDVSVGAQLALIDEGLGLVVEQRIEVGHAVEHERRLVGVRRVAGQKVSRAQRADAAENGLLPLAVDLVCPDEPPPLVALDVSLAVVHAELVLGVGRVGVLGVEQQRAVGAGRVEDTLLVQARLEELEEVVLREELLAVRALHLPRLVQGVADPVVHRDALAAGRAVAVGPDHPGSGDARAEHQAPEFVVRLVHPRFGGLDQTVAEPAGQGSLATLSRSCS